MPSLKQRKKGERGKSSHFATVIHQMVGNLSSRGGGGGKKKRDSWGPSLAYLFYLLFGPATYRKGGQSRKKKENKKKESTPGGDS